MKLTFLGANRQVTGSRYLFEGAGVRLLIDCGLVQERPFLDRNWEDFDKLGIEPAKLDAVLLTHAHLDHSGLLPRLVQQGFDKKILCTGPSVELAALVLRDSARLQEEDAAYKQLRHQRTGHQGPRPVVPLYTSDDAERAIKLLRETPYEQPVDLSPLVSVRYRDAGHILGAVSIELTARNGGGSKVTRVVFSGDIGQWNQPIICDPESFERADYVVMESTYGDKDHQKPPSIEEALAKVINETVAAGGNLVIPTFAIERPQELMYYLNRLERTKQIPSLLVFLDSPMAVDATEIYSRYPRCLDAETRGVLAKGGTPLAFPRLRLCRTRDESRSINSLRGTNIIMAGSGMCTGGRIKHHLSQNIERKESTIMFVGYQSPGTLGREIVDGKPRVRILGIEHDVKARVVQFSGMSAHADRSALFRWMSGFTAPPKRLFLTHGEESVSLALARSVKEKLGWNVHVPAYREAVELE